jgi:hypothetical protein
MKFLEVLMRPTKLIDLAPKNKKKIPHVLKLDEHLEQEFRVLQPQVEAVRPADILLYKGKLKISWNKKRNRLFGLFLCWNSSYCRALLEEDLLEASRLKDDDLQQIRFRGMLLDHHFYLANFFGNFSGNDFYGNFLPQLENFVKDWNLRVLPDKPARRKIRRRGYPNSSRRRPRIPVDGSLKRDMTILFPDSEAQRSEELRRTLLTLYWISIRHSESKKLPAARAEEKEPNASYTIVIDHFTRKK